MAIIGTLTNIGVDKSRSAQSNTGHKIFATGFSVSDVATPGGIPGMRLLTAANGGVWFSGTISSYVVIGTDTVQVICSIPPGIGLVQKDVRDIYLFGRDVDNNTFLLAVGQPANTLLYDPTGQTTLRLQIKLLNSDFASLFQFLFTQATEITEHNQDPNAHAVIQNQIRKAGIFDAPADHHFIGQHFDEFALFEAPVVTENLVYKDVDGLYKRAIADGTNKSIAVGIADKVRNQVYVNGIIEKTHGYPEGTVLYLSDSILGGVTDVNTGYPIGVAFDELHVVLRLAAPKLDVIDFVDVIVSTQPGLRHYTDPQAAIDACPNNGWVRFDELFELHGPNPLDTNGKTINFLFGGVGTGLKTFAGVNEIQKINFTALPTAGDFILEHNGNKTTRLPFNATTGQIETALEALPSITNVTVTGSFASGFTIEFVGVDGLLNQTQINLGTYPGNNEIQRIDFSSDDFSAGTFRLEFNGQTTNSIAFNSINAATIQSELNLLSSIDSVIVNEILAPPPGTKQFTVEFSGAVDGLKPQISITVPQNFLLDSGSAPIGITIAEPTPGVLPDNLLVIGITPVGVTGVTLVQGEPPGGLTAFFLDQPGCQFMGLGTIQDFLVGIDANAKPTTRIEMYFNNVTTPVDMTGLTPDDVNVDGSIGFSFLDNVPDETLFRNLVKVDPTTVPSVSVNVSGAEIILNDGSKHGLAIDDHVSAYPGGSINFSTGVVTGGGASFTPYVAITPNNYFKYAVVLKFDDTLAVVVPSGESNNPNTAPIPAIADGLLRAIVTVRDNGSGGITVISSSSIKRFFDTGAFIKKRQQKIVTSAGGSAFFNTTGVGGFEFDPLNTTLDIDVYLNGNKLEQSTTGGLDKDYRKTSNTQIEFSDSGLSYVVPVDAKVTIEYKTTRIDALTTGIVQANFKSETVFSDDVSHTFTFPTLNWSVLDSVEDLEVFLNGDEQELDKTGTLIGDFRKVSNNQIQFLDGGLPRVIPTTFAKIRAKVRLFALGTSNAVNTISGQDEGSVVVPIIGAINAVGPAVSMTNSPAGVARIQIDGEPNTVTNVGVGPGIFAKPKVGFDIGLRTLRADPGLNVYLDGDEVVVGLAASVYFRNYLTSVASPVLPIGNVYDIGSRRLKVYKNGVRMWYHASIGLLQDRYVENTFNTVQLLQASVATDVFSFTNFINSPTFLDIQTGLSGLTITLPAAIGIGNKRLLVYKNGVLMNTSGLGGPNDRYTETSTTLITLDNAAVPTDVFLMEYASVPYAFREDIAPFVGSTLTITGPLVPGNNKELVFKNGILLHNSNSLGVAGDRYGVTSPTVITLGVPANLTDHFIVINQA